MTGWAPKVFWSATGTEPVPGGYAVTLDGRRAKTPAKAPLVLPTQVAAQAVAAEWGAQTGVLNPTTMPLTRLANAAIDKVAPQQAEVADLVSAYGATDLLCYRATAPAGLMARQAAVWDPVLDWAAMVLDVRLRTAPGVMPVAQPAPALDRLGALVGAMDSFQLAALHDLVALSGSLILSLAVVRGHLTVDAGWSASRVDEDWQIAEWGTDAEAQAITARKQADFVTAARFFALCSG